MSTKVCVCVRVCYETCSKNKRKTQHHTTGSFLSGLSYTLSVGLGIISLYLDTNVQYLHLVEMRGGVENCESIWRMTEWLLVQYY